MSKFSIRLFVFFGILFAGDRLMGLILQQFRPIDYKIFIEAKKQFFHRDSTYNLVIIGDSHAADALNTNVIETNTGLSSFNLSVYHASPCEYYYLAKAMVNHVKPKVVVLGLNPIMFTREVNRGNYTPLVIDDFAFNLQAQLEVGEVLDPDFLFRTIKEKYLFRAIAHKLTGKKYQPTREIERQYRGYLYFENQKADLNWENFSDTTSLEIVDDQIKFFRKTVELLQDEGISVILLNPPIFGKKFDANSRTHNYVVFDSLIKDIANKYELQIYNKDFKILSDSLEKKDFLDLDHLNGHGAEKFSVAFSDWLNHYKLTFINF